MSCCFLNVLINTADTCMPRLGMHVSISDSLHKAQKHRFVKTADNEKLAINSSFASAHSPLKNMGFTATVSWLRPPAVGKTLKQFTPLSILMQNCVGGDSIFHPAIHPPSTQAPISCDPSPQVPHSTLSRKWVQRQKLYPHGLLINYKKTKADPHKKKHPLSAHPQIMHIKIMKPSFAYFLDILPQSEDFSVNHNS